MDFIKKQSTLLIAFGLILFVITLILTLPARLVTDSISERTPVKLTGVTGSIWNGRASAVSVINTPAGPINLGPTTWDVSFLKLLTATAGVDLDIEDNSPDRSGIMGTAEVNYSLLGGQVNIQEADIRTSAAPFIQQFAGNLPADINANLRLLIDHFSADDVNNLLIPVPEVNAQVILSDINVNYGDQYALGNVQVDAVNENGDVIQLTLQDMQAAFELDGQGQLMSDGSYQIAGSIASNADTPLALKDLISMAQGGLSSPDAPAAMRFNQSGQLRL